MAEHDFPAHLRYTPEHEWVLPAGAAATPCGSPTGGGAGEGRAAGAGGAAVRVGITAYAQAELGDIVFVSLPAPGAAVRAGESCGEVESTKSVSDLFAPVDGTVVARNDALEGSPELVNSDPYGEGWLVDIAPLDPAAAGELLDAEAYRAAVG